MTYVIALPCVDIKDKACVEECPVDCIYDDDVPDEWADYYKANVEFFDDLGSPGGAGKLGLIPKDHPIVAAVPREGL